MKTFYWLFVFTVVLFGILAKETDAFWWFQSSDENARAGCLCAVWGGVLPVILGTTLFWWAARHYEETRKRLSFLLIVSLVLAVLVNFCDGCSVTGLWGYYHFQTAWCAFLQSLLVSLIFALAGSLIALRKYVSVSSC